MRTIVPPDEGSYSYAGMGYANPDAVTQIANGLRTTTALYPFKWYPFQAMELSTVRQLSRF